MADAMNDELLQAIGPHLITRCLPAGHMLWREGDTEGFAILLRSGRIKAVRTLHGGREVPIFLFSEGDLFGFLPLLDGGTYPVSAVTVDAVEVGMLSKARLLMLMRTDTTLSMALLRALSSRLREAMHQIQLLTTRGATARVAAALVAMLDNPHVTSGHTVLTLPVSAHYLSEALNLTPPTLSRSLTQLVDEGVLHRLGTGRFQVLQPGVLRERALEGVDPELCSSSRCALGWS